MGGVDYHSLVITGAFAERRHEVHSARQKQLEAFSLSMSPISKHSFARLLFLCWSRSLVCGDWGEPLLLEVWFEDDVDEENLSFAFLLGV